MLLLMPWLFYLVVVVVVVGQVGRDSSNRIAWTEFRDVCRKAAVVAVAWCERS